MADYLYLVTASLGTPPKSYVHIIDLDSFSKVDSLTLSTEDEDPVSCVLSADESTLYIGCRHRTTVRPSIVEVQLPPANFLRVGQAATWGNNLHGSAPILVRSPGSGEYDLFFAEGTNPMRLVRTKTDVSPIEILTDDNFVLPANEGATYTAVIDKDGIFGYWAATASLPDLSDNIVKINLQEPIFSQSRAGASSLNDGEVDLRCAVIGDDSQFAYFGTNQDPGRIIKFDLFDFTRVGSIVFPSGTGSFLSAAIDGRSEFAYFTDTKIDTNNRVEKIRLSDFTNVAELGLGSGHGGGSQVTLIDKDDLFLYVVKNGNLTKISKIDLASFTVNSVLALSDDTEAAVRCGAITRPMIIEDEGGQNIPLGGGLQPWFTGAKFRRFKFEGGGDLWFDNRRPPEIFDSTVNVRPHGRGKLWRYTKDWQKGR